MQRENKWQDRVNKMVDIIANIAFKENKGLNSNELKEIHSQLTLFIQSEIDMAVAEERGGVMGVNNSLENNGTNYIQTNQSDFRY